MGINPLPEFEPLLRNMIMKNSKTTKAVKATQAKVRDVSVSFDEFIALRGINSGYYNAKIIGLLIVAWKVLDFFLRNNHLPANQ